jgi:hypothetical protein
MIPDLMIPDLRRWAIGTASVFWRAGRPIELAVEVGRKRAKLVSPPYLRVAISVRISGK